MRHYVIVVAGGSYVNHSTCVHLGLALLDVNATWCTFVLMQHVLWENEEQFIPFHISAIIMILLNFPGNRRNVLCWYLSTMDVLIGALRKKMLQLRHPW